MGIGEGDLAAAAAVKSVQQFYVGNADADDEDKSSSSTDTDEGLGIQRIATATAGNDCSGTEEDEDEEAVYPGGKKQVAFGQLVRRTETKLAERSSPREQPAFRTLAQLIDPHRHERIKYCTKRRSSYLPRGSAAKKRSFRSSYKTLVTKTSRRHRHSAARNIKGAIDLVVDLVFEKDIPADGLSCSSSIAPAEDGASTKLSSQDSTSPDVVTPLDQEEEQSTVVPVTDPVILTTARMFTSHAASSTLPPHLDELKWREVDVGGIDPVYLMNRSCKVFWALENRWVKGLIQEYSQCTKKFRVVYSRNDEKWHVLGKERLALYIFLSEKFTLILRDAAHSGSKNKSSVLTEDILVLAAMTEDADGNFGHGDVVWAEVAGYPFWPAFVMDEQHARSCGLETPANGTLPVQFFGTHDCARVSCRRVAGFAKGLHKEYHLKCKRILFEGGFEELDGYLKRRKLPQAMAHLEEEAVDTTSSQPHPTKKLKESGNDNDEEFVGDERKFKVRKSLESIFKCPIKLGSLRVLSLGKIVKDSEYFHDQHYIWTEGYTAIRKFFSTRNPTRMVSYKMEVLKNPMVRTMPLFRVTPEDAEQVEGPTAAICWKKIFDKLQKARNKLFANVQQKRRQFYRSGAAMFGFSHPRVSRLIQALPYARVCSKFKAWAIAKGSEDVDGLLPAGFKHVEGDWKHLDRCSVCYTNEEYEGNVLLQCDKCRMLVHLNCYGVLEPPGDSWLCTLCSLKVSPPCCLCPIKDGAMKRTTDGRWVHLACAMWMPETCCVDMDKMEPIDGIGSINKERWKLTCTICTVPYGACIQCADHHCRVAFHPLCARAAGFCTKILEGFRRKRNQTGDHEEERSVQLLSYCKKHMQSGRSVKATNELSWSSDEYAYSSYNHSGCARTEPYNDAVRRGRREPEHYSAALAKRNFLENRPYIVTGCLRRAPSKQQVPGLLRRRGGSDEVALSTSERFNQMRSSLHQRLTFGKSAIHGWGLFAKEAHAAGDMVIEYAGEVIRPVVADVREKSCYDSLVGAGTYMFCIDNERVIDATRSGSIAHLINHSCEPNCYSRVVAANGKERIIIFAKQDIAGGEEVTYDYRFTSLGEKLACHCGTAGCRGIVNVMDEEDESGRILVNLSELTKWN